MRRGLLLLFAAAALAFASGALAITYGEPDGNGHPNVGAVIADYRQDGHLDVFCSGSLVAPTVFLTASHCTQYLEQKGITEVYVTLDPEYVEGSSTLHPGEMHTNPAYSQRQSDPNDIAVITLDEPVTGVTPVELPTENLLDATRLKGQAFTSVGYGVLEPTRGHGPPDWPFTGERRVSVGTFQSLTKAWLKVSQNSATGDAGTCYGDSGGPQFLGSSNLQVSLTVTGDAMCIATNVDYRLDTDSARSFLGRYVTLP